MVGGLNNKTVKDITVLSIKCPAQAVAGVI